MNRDDIFVPQSDDNIGRMALIEAVRANTDAVSRMATQGVAYGQKLDHINDELGKMNVRLALIENNSLERDLERVRKCTVDLEKRVDDLEAERQRRVGALGLVEWLGKNWPALVALVALVAFLVSERLG